MPCTLAAHRTRTLQDPSFLDANHNNGTSTANVGGDGSMGAPSTTAASTTQHSAYSLVEIKDLLSQDLRWRHPSSTLPSPATATGPTPGSSSMSTLRVPASVASLPLNNEPRHGSPRSLGHSASAPGVSPRSSWWTASATSAPHPQLVGAYGGMHGASVSTGEPSVYRGPPAPSTGLHTSHTGNASPEDVHRRRSIVAAWARQWRQQQLHEGAGPANTGTFTAAGSGSAAQRGGVQQPSTRPTKLRLDGRPAPSDVDAVGTYPARMETHRAAAAAAAAASAAVSGSPLATDGMPRRAALRGGRMLPRVDDDVLSASPLSAASSLSDRPSLAMETSPIQLEDDAGNGLYVSSDSDVMDDGSEGKADGTKQLDFAHRKTGRRRRLRQRSRGSRRKLKGGKRRPASEGARGASHNKQADDGSRLPAIVVARPSSPPLGKRGSSDPPMSPTKMAARRAAAYRARQRKQQAAASGAAGDDTNGDVFPCALLVSGADHVLGDAALTPNQRGTIGAAAEAFKLDGVREEALRNLRSLVIRGTRLHAPPWWVAQYRQDESGIQPASAADATGADTTTAPRKRRRKKRRKPKPDAANSAGGDGDGDATTAPKSVSEVGDGVKKDSSRTPNEWGALSLETPLTSGTDGTPLLLRGRVRTRGTVQAAPPRPPLTPPPATLSDDGDDEAGGIFELTKVVRQPLPKPQLALDGDDAQGGAQQPVVERILSPVTVDGDDATDGVFEGGWTVGDAVVGSRACPGRATVPLPPSIPAAGPVMVPMPPLSRAVLLGPRPDAGVDDDVNSGAPPSDMPTWSALHVSHGGDPTGRHHGRSSHSGQHNNLEDEDGGPSLVSAAGGARRPSTQKRTVVVSTPPREPGTKPPARRVCVSPGVAVASIATAERPTEVRTRLMVDDRSGRLTFTF